MNMLSEEIHFSYRRKKKKKKIGFIFCHLWSQTEVKILGSLT